MDMGFWEFAEKLIYVGCAVTGAISLGYIASYSESIYDEFRKIREILENQSKLEKKIKDQQ